MLVRVMGWSRRGGGPARWPRLGWGAKASVSERQHGRQRPAWRRLKSRAPSSALVKKVPHHRDGRLFYRAAQPYIYTQPSRINTPSLLTDFPLFSRRDFIMAPTALPPPQKGSIATLQFGALFSPQCQTTSPPQSDKQGQVVVFLKYKCKSKEKEGTQVCVSRKPRFYEQGTWEASHSSELSRSSLYTHTHAHRDTHARASGDMSRHHSCGACTDVCLDTTRFLPQAFL